MFRGTIILAAILIAGAYFSGVFNGAGHSRANQPENATNGTPGDGSVNTDYTPEECTKLIDQMRDDNLANSDINGRPNGLGEAMRQTAAIAGRLKRMHDELKSHNCLKEGDGSFREPQNTMGPATPEMQPPDPMASPSAEPTWGAAR